MPSNIKKQCKCLSCYSSTVIALIILFSIICLAASPLTEYQVKAGFLYKLLFFVEWPEEAFADAGETIVIGILGEDPFGDVFEPVEGTTVNGRTLVIKRFSENTPPEMLRRCHLLFISPSLKPHMEIILASLKDSPVLTVSEVKGFIDRGGMFNFIINREGRVGFEINISAAEQCGVRFRAKLLRLAVRIIEDTHGN